MTYRKGYGEVVRYPRQCKVLLTVFLPRPGVCKAFNTGTSACGNKCACKAFIDGVCITKGAQKKRPENGDKSMLMASTIT